ncbi:S-layer homology domain-containing protein [Actinomarinicola tropica]|uniref:SLH domain-containing protein n=1 Tax=Actinomarinicola tropica TaxID=2789776 RepID=A0A5Q2RIP4_9ACTN|nr:S-layer homology domain-containing protein [Actinomarinicola tropica]QGG96649.1 hypothetical protein GH723_16955 [Actinomarinicola tropica]
MGTRRWRVVAVGVVALLVASVAAAPGVGADTVWWTPVERPGRFSELALTADGRVMAFGPSHLGRVEVSLQSRNGQWGPPTVLLPGDGYSKVELVVGAHEGDTYVLWTAYSRAYNSSPIAGGARLRGNAWSSLPTQSISGELGDVAMGPDGSIVVVRATGQHDSQVMVTRFDGTSWSEPERLDTGDLSYHTVDVEVAADGSVVVAGTVLSDSQWVLHASVDRGHGWEAPRRLSDGGMGHLAMASTSSGEVVAVYSDRGELESSTLSAVTYADGVWSSPQVVVDAEGLNRPVLEVEPDGALTLGVVAVRPPQGSAAAGTLRVLWTRRVGGTWSPVAEAVRMPFGRGSSRELALAVGPDGTAALVVRLAAVEHGGNHTMMSVRPRGKGWLDPFETELGAGDPAVAVDGAGLVHVASSDHNSGMQYRVILVMPFSDVAPYAYYASAVVWAADLGLTTGVGGSDEFQPDRAITRAEAITALWRHAGRPGSRPSSFIDVPRAAFYTAAVDWAASTGLTTGVGGLNVFEPDRTITRAELLTLLWRSAGSPSAPAAGFTDVVPGGFYARAVDWARHEGITTGVGGTNRFEPDRNITRAEAFTFLFRAEMSGVAVASAVDPLDAMTPSRSFAVATRSDVGP